VHAVPRGHHLARDDPARILDGHGRPEDLDLLMDVSDNISPGIAWPPKQTTICPLGPSAVSPIASALQRFRPEFEAYVEAAEARRIPVRAAGPDAGTPDEEERAVV
jgi:NADH-quinone oxidoreductase subunit F